MAWTNLGKEHMFAEFFASGTVDDTFRLILCSATQVNDGLWDAATSSTADLSAVSSLPNADNTEGGYSGLIIVRDASSDGANFDVSNAVDLGGGSLASSVRAVLQTGDDAFQFSGEFNGARYAVLVRAGAEGSPFDFANSTENVYAWWDIGQETNISEGNTLTITSLSLQGQ